jgi:O-antigen ligase
MPITEPRTVSNGAGTTRDPLLGLIVIGISLAFIASEILIGGTHLLFAFPAYALLALVGLAGIWRAVSARNSGEPACFLGTALFFGYVLSRAAFSPDHYLARFDIYSILAGLIVYFLTATVLTDPRRRLSVLAILLVAGVVHSLVGAVQFRNGNNWMPIPFLPRLDYGSRASGFYLCPNHLAGLLEVVGIFGLSISLWSRWPAWAKLLTGYATLICYIGVILSGSRGGYLSTLFSLFVFVLLSLRITRAAGSALSIRLTTAGVVLAALAGIGAFLVISNSDYLTTRTQTVVDNTDIRLNYWRAAVKQWELNPAFGTGSRTYLYYARRFREPSVQMDPVYVHNDYLQLLAEYGIVGFVAFAAFFVVHLRAGWISARRLGPRRITATNRIRSNSMALNVGALGAIAAYSVHSFFDFNLHIPANLLVMAFVFGILANSGIQQERPGPRRAVPTLTGVTLAALSIVLAVQVYRLAPGEWYAERARIALREKQPAAALSAALAGVRFEQRNPQLFCFLGRSYQLSGERPEAAGERTSLLEAAIPAYQKATQLAPSDDSYLMELAYTLDSLNRFAEAEPVLDRALELDPKADAVRHYYELHLQRWKGTGQPKLEEPVPPEPPA